VSHISNCIIKLFCHCDIIPERSNLKEGKMFGPVISDICLYLVGPIVSAPVVRWYIMAEGCSRAMLLTSWQTEADRERDEGSGDKIYL
jgi:hypothetical protein